MEGEKVGEVGVWFVVGGDEEGVWGWKSWNDEGGEVVWWRVESEFSGSKEVW